MSNDITPTTNSPGIVTILAHLPPDAVVDYGQYARMFGLHTKTVERAVCDGKLPPPFNQATAPRSDTP